MDRKNSDIGKMEYDESIQATIQEVGEKKRGKHDKPNPITTFSI
jgi:hypothetical protein